MFLFFKKKGKRVSGIFSNYSEKEPAHLIITISLVFLITDIFLSLLCPVRCNDFTFLLRNIHWQYFIAVFFLSLVPPPLLSVVEYYIDSLLFPSPLNRGYSTAFFYFISFIFFLLILVSSRPMISKVAILSSILALFCCFKWYGLPLHFRVSMKLVDVERTPNLHLPILFSFHVNLAF